MRFQPDNFPGDDREYNEAPSDRTAGREVEYLRHLAKEQTPVAVHLRTGPMVSRKRGDANGGRCGLSIMSDPVAADRISELFLTYLRHLAAAC